MGALKQQPPWMPGEGAGSRGSRAPSHCPQLQLLSLPAPSQPGPAPWLREAPALLHQRAGPRSTPTRTCPSSTGLQSQGRILSLGDPPMRPIRTCILLLVPSLDTRPLLCTCSPPPTQARCSATAARPSVHPRSGSSPIPLRQAPPASSFFFAFPFPRGAVEFIQYLSSQHRVREDIINVKETGCKCFWTWLQLEGDFSKGQ